MTGGYLSGIFGSSPVRPLQKHMEQVVACVGELIPYVDAVLAGDLAKRDGHHRKIIDLEHKSIEHVRPVEQSRKKSIGERKRAVGEEYGRFPGGRAGNDSS